MAKSAPRGFLALLASVAFVDSLTALALAQNITCEDTTFCLEEQICEAGLCTNVSDSTFEPTCGPFLINITKPMMNASYEMGAVDGVDAVQFTVEWAGDWASIAVRGPGFHGMRQLDTYSFDTSTLDRVQDGWADSEDRPTADTEQNAVLVEHTGSRVVFYRLLQTTDASDHTLTPGVDGDLAWAVGSGFVFDGTWVQHTHSGRGHMHTFTLASCSNATDLPDTQAPASSSPASNAPASSAPASNAPAPDVTDGCSEDSDCGAASWCRLDRLAGECLETRVCVLKRLEDEPCISSLSPCFHELCADELVCAPGNGLGAQGVCTKPLGNVFTATCGPFPINITKPMMNASYEMGAVDGVDAVQFTVEWAGDWASIAVRGPGFHGMRQLDTYSFDTSTLDRVQDGWADSEDRPTADTEQNAVLVEHTGSRVVFYRLLQTTDASDHTLTPGVDGDLAWAVGSGFVFDGTWVQHTHSGRGHMHTFTLASCSNATDLPDTQAPASSSPASNAPASSAPASNAPAPDVTDGCSEDSDCGAASWCRLDRLAGECLETRVCVLKRLEDEPCISSLSPCFHELCADELVCAPGNGLGAQGVCTKPLGNVFTATCGPFPINITKPMMNASYEMGAVDGVDAVQFTVEWAGDWASIAVRGPGFHGMRQLDTYSFDTSTLDRVQDGWADSEDRPTADTEQNAVLVEHTGSRVVFYRLLQTTDASDHTLTPGVDGDLAWAVGSGFVFDGTWVQHTHSGRGHMHTFTLASCSNATDLPDTQAPASSSPASNAPASSAPASNAPAPDVTDGCSEDSDCGAASWCRLDRLAGECLETRVCVLKRLEDEPCISSLSPCFHELCADELVCAPGNGLGAQGVCTKPLGNVFTATCGPFPINITKPMMNASYEMGAVDGVDAVQFTVEWAGDWASIAVRGPGFHGMRQLDTYSFDTSTLDRVQDGWADSEDRPTADTEQNAVLVEHTGSRVVFYRLLQTTDASDHTLTPGVDGDLAWAVGSGFVFDGTWVQHTHSGRGHMHTFTLASCSNATDLPDTQAPASSSPASNAPASSAPASNAPAPDVTDGCSEDSDCGAASWCRLDRLAGECLETRVCVLKRLEDEPCISSLSPCFHELCADELVCAPGNGLGAQGVCTKPLGNVFTATCGPFPINITKPMMNASYEMGAVDGVDAVQFTVEWAGDWASIAVRGPGFHGMRQLDTYSFDTSTLDRVQDGWADSEDRPTADTEQNAVLVEHTGSRVVFYRLLQTTDASDHTLTPGVDGDLAWAVGSGFVFDGTWVQHTHSGRGHMHTFTLASCSNATDLPDTAVPSTAAPVSTDSPTPEVPRTDTPTVIPETPHPVVATLLPETSAPVGDSPAPPQTSAPQSAAPLIDTSTPATHPPTSQPAVYVPPKQTFLDQHGTKILIGVGALMVAAAALTVCVVMCRAVSRQCVPPTHKQVYRRIQTRAVAKRRHYANVRQDAYDEEMRYVEEDDDDLFADMD